MEIHVDVIEEKSYTVKIDVPEEEEDNLFDELSCEPCMEDIHDVMNFLEGKGYAAEKFKDEKEYSRIETWR